MHAEDTAAKPDDMPCWVCGSVMLNRLSSGGAGKIEPDDLKITDDRYGLTADIYRCADCGFLQCSDVSEVTSAYEQMDDADYEGSRDARVIQARDLLRHVKNAAGSSLLDIGAGTGILVEEAGRIGINATGVEPSKPLSLRAKARGLNVVQGILPHPAVDGKFDAVTLIDVIEHVRDPVGLLRLLASHMSDSGQLLLVTPDVKSLPARLMGRRWWHFRLAHIGYFDKSTLTKALANAGLKPVSWYRPTWWFPVAYLKQRLHRYLPPLARVGLPARLSDISVPLNLRDSWLVVAEKI